MYILQSSCAVRIRRPKIRRRAQNANSVHERDAGASTNYFRIANPIMHTNTCDGRKLAAVPPVFIGPQEYRITSGWRQTRSLGCLGVLNERTPTTLVSVPPPSRVVKARHSSVFGGSWKRDRSIWQVLLYCCRQVGLTQCSEWPRDGRLGFVSW